MTQVALITGAGSGIGRALADLLAQQGYAIAAIDRREDGLRTLGEKLAGKPFAWAVADVTDAAGLQQVVTDLEAKLGPTDLVIASAGVGIETSGIFYNCDDMNKVLNVNLIGVSNTIGAVLPGMVIRRRGHVVAISSAASYRGLPRMLAYSASKAGVNAIMDGLRIEMKPLGIHITTVCPGWIRTPMTANVNTGGDTLLDAEDAAREIYYAIATKKSFYTFPRRMRWRMRLLTMLPRSWQDWYITRLMRGLKVK